MLHHKPKYNYQVIILYTISFIIVLLLSINTFSMKTTTTISEPNYLGLAKLGLIPSQIECTHEYNAYDSTGVIMQNKEGTQYLILESKFGDESCLYKL